MNISIISFAVIIFLIGTAVILFFSIREWIKINKEIEKSIKEIKKQIKEKRKEFERIKNKGAF